MNYGSIKRNLKSVAISVMTVGIGCLSMQSCTEDILTGQPSWLGNSIYERLQDEGNYTNTLRLIDDLDYTDVLSMTGSKTLFVANDDAYAEFFKNNSWGVTKYDDLSTAQKKLLLNSSMVNNAYLVELLSNISGNPPLEGRCMRREAATSVFDSISRIYPAEMPNTKYWTKHKGKTGGMVLLRDNTAKPMIHFLPRYMSVNSITDNDLSILTNGQSNSIADAWVNGKKIIERDITCKNGYIQKVDGVMSASDNMAEIIHSHPNMSLWGTMMDRYSAPYYDDASTKTYNRLYNNTDSVFVLKYFATTANNGTTGTDPDNKAVSATLTFDPEWNQYIQNDGSGQTLNYDCGAMLVPSDEAVNYWWSHDGKALQDEYGDMESVPDNVLSKLINVHMIPSFASHVPSKFANITNDANMEMGVETKDVDSCFMGCNGVVYLTNKVFSPAAYSSVSFPALIRRNSTMAIVYWAIENLGFDQYLNSMDSYYSLLLPSDDAFLTYIDPCSYGSNTKVLYQTRWSDEKKTPEVTRYKYNATTGTIMDKIDVIYPTTDKDGNIASNRLYDILDNLIIVDKLESGKTYYQTKGGGTVKIVNPDEEGRMLVSSGHEEETGKPLNVSTVYDQTRSGNGKAYVINDAIPMSGEKSVYKTLSEHAEYSRFFDLLKGGDPDSVDYNLMVNQIDKKYSCVDYNIRLFNAYNYTVWIPTNESLDKLHSEGVLPYWTDFEAQTTEAWGGDAAKAKEARYVIKNRIVNFLRYHIQDNSLYVGAGTYSGKYETSKMNPVNNKFYTLSCSSDGSNLAVTDQLNETRNVIKTAGLYNDMCREYQYTEKDKENAYNGTLWSSSYAVVHLIDGPLMYEQMSPINFTPGSNAKKRNVSNRSYNRISRR